MKKYRIFYKDDLIAEVIDYDKGFIDTIEGMNAEMDCVEIEQAGKETNSGKWKEKELYDWKIE